MGPGWQRWGLGVALQGAGSPGLTPALPLTRCVNGLQLTQLSETWFPHLEKETDIKSPSQAMVMLRRTKGPEQAQARGPC